MVWGNKPRYIMTTLHGGGAAGACSSAVMGSDGGAPTSLPPVRCLPPSSCWTGRVAPPWACFHPFTPHKMPHPFLRLGPRPGPAVRHNSDMVTCHLPVGVFLGLATNGRDESGAGIMLLLSPCSRQQPG
ncbi:hypothetical protein CALVIDRAFT_96904 [Calocera viscosa TUFC12733]|uniref:Uncharacterized protein n=1 Tax=Calocera viscosa (strain TUFC12733) TaxID=1330018 RepID=A0A167MZF9_CALVF|nr:hypothetical protein CALVIDRAFT_96904 [Calocera viscosa TUFC12733]